MNISTLPSNFYPTPESLIQKMFDKIKSFRNIYNVLEPSAGKGDIALFLANKLSQEHHENSYSKVGIDCIEIDPYLQQSLKYNFRKDRFSPYYKEISELDKLLYATITDSQRRRKNELQLLVKSANISTRLVADDFITYSAFKKYDLIMMNPPFDNGEKHLLKAIEIMQRGGQIVCLLNAETLKNPFSNTRKDLVRKLDELDADIEYLQDEFTQAERKTDVEIALVHITIEHKKSVLDESSIFEDLRKAKAEEQIRIEEEQGLTIHKNYIELAVDNYSLEVEATIKLIEEYQAFKRYIPQSFSEDNYSRGSILKLIVDTYDTEKHEVDVNEYLQVVRMKYWNALFTNKDFTNALTSNLLNDFQSQISKMADYDFSVFNIKNVQIELSQNMVKGAEDTIMKLFEDLSNKYSYYDETSKNIYLYNGWKTNKSYKINDKVIIPYTANITSSYKYEGSTRVPYSYFGGTGIDKLKDMEKALNYLDGGLSAPVDIVEQLQNAASAGKTSKIELKYFNVTFYKKGTCHIVFTNKDLLAKFNLFGSQRKGWLPPSYGKKSYSEMNTEEKTVVDDFQGEAEYKKVMQRKDYFLFNSNSIKALPQAIEQTA